MEAQNRCISKAILGFGTDDEFLPAKHALTLTGCCAKWTRAAYREAEFPGRAKPLLGDEVLREIPGSDV